MTTAFTRRTWGSSLLAAGMVIPTATVGGSAVAAPTCGDATLIAPGICEIVMYSAGTFTPPAGVTKVAAVLVGGGGGGYQDATGYGGGGGEVTYVDAVALTGPLVVTVGKGGSLGTSPSSASDGGDTTLNSYTARGGQAGVFANGGASGSGNAGWSTLGNSPGGGAKSAATATAPGSGYVFSDIPGVDSTLFPIAFDLPWEFGQGGAPAASSPNPGSGSGGGYSAPDPGLTFDGAQGSVILRFAPAEESTPPRGSTPPGGEKLAATGANDTSLLASVLGLGLIVAGAAIVARPRRTAARRH